MQYVQLMSTNKKFTLTKKENKGSASATRMMNQDKMKPTRAM